MDARTSLTFKVDLPRGSERLRELTLYVCQACATAERFGRVKLNKILWRADFTAYAERRTPVTGRPYLKLAAGPAPVEMAALLTDMEAQGLLAFSRRDHGDGYIEDRPEALRAPDLRLFSRGDIGFVDASIRFYWRKCATAASELSHQVAWKSRGFLDPLPYESVFFSDTKPTAKERERFAEIATARKLKSL